MGMGSATSDRLIVMNKKELADHVKKLDRLQKKLTSEAHIEKVNAFIPAAERFARENGGTSAERSKLFVQEMNRLTSEAGLRCV
ncbi:MAG: hypothetical protein KKD01_01195 [Proteobacteria bacterium]|nr:hypothetical protein [Pseudomonadota bacterium]MBU1418281.1 hypothetical protein [Pseudomonadota bacterium]MBU1453315.1 hypothetical protein [Pseudomonadota bacterium]